jgi:SHS2 domain-containing protein
MNMQTLDTPDRLAESTPRLASHPAYWEHFPHAADIGVRGYGRTPDEAFAQAALAMMAVIAEPRRIEAHEAITLDCRAPDLELLLTDWLNALIFTMATRHLLFCCFDVHITGHHLRATAWGEPLDAARHQPAVEIKGATFTELRVACLGPELWLAQCVVDV